MPTRTKRNTPRQAEPRFCASARAARMNSPTLPNRLWPFSFHFYRQFPWGCLGVIVFPVLSRGAFASIAYATKRLTDTVLSMHNPAAESHQLLAPFGWFVGLVVARFAI